MSVDPRQLITALSATSTLSGAELARRLGVTRAAIWKQIESLRALGAPIQATPGRGYRMQWPLLLLDANRIRDELDAKVRRRIGDLQIHWQVDSTSSELRRNVAQGAADLSICLAETQTAGRGRRGRVWQSRLGGNVYLSLLYRFPGAMSALAGLSLAAGVALIEALHDCGVDGVGLKWPNDVVADGRKLAGILVELGGEFLGPCFAIIGIGVNVHLPDGSSIDQPYVDLERLCHGSPPPRDRLVACIIARLVAVMDRFQDAGFAAIRADYARHDVLSGRRIRIQAGPDTLTGIAAGVDSRGALRVRHGKQVRSYDSAEVSVRTK